MKYKDHYQTRLIEDNGVLVFQFVSTGLREIFKTIEFHKQTYEVFSRPVYSLIFSDYKDANHNIRNFDLSNNGDVYKVFHTVLSTIPLFFIYHPEAAILVQASDNVGDFFKTCIHSCNKGCTHSCREEGRRIRIYRSFLNKYFGLFSETYEFAGGIRSRATHHFYISKYEPGKAYDEIILFQKK